MNTMYNIFRKTALVIFVVLLANYVNATNEITFTTKKNIGSKVKLVINAALADRPDVWLDLNNNGTKDSGEAITVFSSTTSYTIGAKFFTLYGNVTYLACSGNELTNLDVTNDDVLTELYCGNNQLENLELSNNDQLITLSCKGNKLESLNLFNNLNLKGLFCENNNIKSLDISDNTHLKKLYCYNNELESLNVANGNNEHFVSLDKLPVFDSRKNPNLKCIDIDDGFTPAASWKKDETSDWKNDIFDCKPDAIKESYNTQTVDIYPNPAREALIVNISENIVCKNVKIFNVAGEIITITVAKTGITKN